MAEPELYLGLPASETRVFCTGSPAFGFDLRSLPSRYARNRAQRQWPWLHVLGTLQNRLLSSELPSLFQEAFSRQCESSTIFRRCVCLLHCPSHTWFFSRAAWLFSGPFLEMPHFSCCLAFSLWKVNALLAFAEWYQQGSLGNYTCKWLLMPIAFSP